MREETINICLDNIGRKLWYLFCASTNMKQIEVVTCLLLKDSKGAGRSRRTKMGHSGSVPGLWTDYHLLEEKSISKADKKRKPLLLYLLCLYHK